MQPLSKEATAILDRMEPDRPYEPQDLRAFLPDANVERLREIMHELWVGRRVERVGYSGWRRQHSAPAPAPPPAPRQAEHVSVEDLFDHATFADVFK